MIPFIDAKYEPIVSLEDTRPISVSVGSNITVLAGTNVTVTCHASGIPKPGLTWSRDNNPLVSNGNNLILVIPAASAADSGQYDCTAISAIGYVTEKTTLIVKGFALYLFPVKLISVEIVCLLRYWSHFAPKFK